MGKVKKEGTRRKPSKFDEKKPPIILLPKTQMQGEYIKALKSSEQVIVLGPAGTGKTYIASVFAASLYQTKSIDKIILTRPNIGASKSIGYFPGTLEEKMSPWMAPVIDVLNKILTPAVVEIAINSKNIEIVPFETMRGRSFENAFVILDEAQNTTPHEMKMFLTRIGENSKVLLNGDVSQSDIQETSGLSKTIMMVKKHCLPVPVIEFTIQDVVRSPLCKMWIEAFIAEEKRNG
jgi:phosphate starvation-inducible PhoH-like protein